MKKHAPFKIIIVVCGLCLVIIAILFVISGFFMPKKYMEPWKKDYSARFSDPRVKLTSVGILAASNHNMQPWKIKLDKNDPNVFYLYADSSRRTKEVDPYSRQMMISEGTFLEYVRVAGDEEGLHADIKLFSEGTYDESNLVHSMDTLPVARITLTKTQKHNNQLYNAMFLPDTNRDAYKPDKLTEVQVNSFESLSLQNGPTIKVYENKDDIARIGKFAMQAADIEAGVTRVMDESNIIFRSNEYRKNKYRYGYSVEGQGADGFKKNIIQGIVTIFPSLNTGKSASNNFINYTRKSVDSTPAYVIIKTNGNSRLEQVESGMIYSRLVLTGHRLGLAMQPLSQALEEYPEMQVSYKSIKQAYASEGSTIQMLLRTGQPEANVPLSMRRDVKELIINK